MILPPAFLFDEHVDRRSLQLLRAAGVDVVHVTDAGLSGATVFRWAQREHRMIVTRNYLDYAPLAQAIASRGESFPGVSFYPSSIRHGDVEAHAKALLAWIRRTSTCETNPVANGFDWLSSADS